MAVKTNIQWCDSTVNPIMGCGGCELYPKPKTIMQAIDRQLALAGTDGWKRGFAQRFFQDQLAETWEKLISMFKQPGTGHLNALTTTNLYHMRELFSNRVAAAFGKKAGDIGLNVITTALKCYAAKLHLNKSYSIVNPTRKPNKGYAPSFEQITRFEGRVSKLARLPDLFGMSRKNEPWLDGMPRLIFLSDMGDALSRVGDFDFLRKELAATQSDAGRRHIWLWLTKRPELMQKFGDLISGFPNNVCTMTTITSPATLHRVDSLREVDAKVRGLSIEPLWGSIADQLDLTGIDWVIVGGESGTPKDVSPFHVEWAEELYDLCRTKGVAYFLKQLGRRPVKKGVEFRLKDKHGGDWDEWQTSLRIRELPAYFHDYRQSVHGATQT